MTRPALGALAPEIAAVDGEGRRWRLSGQHGRNTVTGPMIARASMISSMLYRQACIAIKCTYNRTMTHQAITSSRRTTRSVLFLSLLSLVAVIGGCGGGAESEPASSADVEVRLVSVDTAAEVFENQPEDLVLLDVRTPEEFDAGHLDGAIMIDFYEDDFASQIADLDRDQPYLLYCRSGNRSGQTRLIMEELGFTNVSDVDGGINAWVGAGQPVVP